MRLLERCKVVTGVEAKCAIEKLSTFVVDIRARHVSDDQSAEGITDIIANLLADYSFWPERSFDVFKLCCMVVVKPRQEYPVKLMST